MITTAAISDTEVRSVQDGIVNDVREDGRALLQRRPATLRATRTLTLGDANDYNGSSVAVSVEGGTTVLAAASPSVVEVSVEDDGEEEGEGKGHGPLHITIDAAPAVVDFYASALGGRSGQYRRSYLAHAALAIRHVFGAESVSVDDRQSGVAEAQLVGDDDDEAVGAKGDDDGEEEGGGRGGSSSIKHPTTDAGKSNSSDHRRLPTGYPSQDLYIGKGYAFRIDLDVHVQQASGGNLLSCIALAVHAALRTVRLPSVTLHDSAAGVSIEVDRSKAFHRAVDWSRLPLLAVLLLSPTRHYVADPTAREELALPQQLQVAAGRDGHVCYSRYCQYPSRAGGAKLMLFTNRDANTNMTNTGGGVRKQPKASDATAAYAAMYELHPADLLAAVADATHLCEAMIAECDEAVAALLTA